MMYETREDPIGSYH
uniref:Uncharacterized protein n=1 Tax=Rhizophora mucronata TaxID=61149 RepID=A0A2P2NSV0_RHIMU